MRVDDETVWLPAVCPHGCENTSSVVKLQRGMEWWSPACFVRKGARRLYRWHTAAEDAPAGNRLTLAKKPRKPRSDKGVKRGPRS